MIGQNRPVGRARQIRNRIGQNRPANQPRPQGGRRPGTPIPFSFGASSAVNEALNARNQTLSGLNTKSLATEQSYGLTGPWSDAKSNPYSRAAQLQQSYEQARRGNINSSASAGQLYAGSLQNANSATRGDYDSKLNDLWTARNADVAEIAQDRLAANNDFRGVRVDSRLEAIADAMKEDPEPQASPRRNSPRRNQIRNRVTRPNRNRGPIRNQGIR